MDQLVIQPDIPNPDEPELTWENVGIALTFILVDGTPLQSLLLRKSRFFNRFRPWYREIHSRSFSTMSYTTDCNGTYHSFAF